MERLINTRNQTRWTEGFLALTLDRDHMVDNVSPKVVPVSQHGVSNHVACFGINCEFSRRVPRRGSPLGTICFACRQIHAHDGPDSLQGT